MSWSYSFNPSSSVKDAVRFEIQDTRAAAPLLQDEEIEYAIKLEAPANPPSEGEVLSAAARCMEARSRLFRMQADQEFGAVRTAYVNMAKGYDEQAQKLRLKAQGKHAPFSGGESVSEKNALEQNEDLEQPFFRRDLFHNPYVGMQIPILQSGLLPGEGQR